MNKRIKAVLLSLVMVVGLLATAVPASAAGETSFNVTADKTTANPGDTITYAVELGSVTNMGGVAFELEIPAGLTYVASSATYPSDLQAKMDAFLVKWIEETKIFMVASCDYSSTEATTLLTFQCTVDEEASGEKTVALVIDPDNVLDTDDELMGYTVTNAKVTVTAAPKPATSVTLNKDATTIYTGADETLVATVLPADTTDTLSWTSSNPAVATVDTNGKVTAVAPGTATITATAGSQSDSCVVTVENAPCVHSFTAQTKNAETLKTAGTCKDEAVYYYSCANCGEVEHNDSHTFLGDKDSSNHAGGTEVVNAKPADHKNQINGYTGDTKCLGCGEILAKGSAIPAGAHEAASEWSKDEDYHWKECSIVGCGTVITETKAAHSSTGANVATCQHKAVCDVCGAEYGGLGGHSAAAGYTSDATGHWNACQNAGCTEKLNFASHTPDHEGHATEEYAIKCSICDYVIEAQLDPTEKITSVEALITAPELGATPDFDPTFITVPADGLELPWVDWYKIPVEDFTGTVEDSWDSMDEDEEFELGYIYNVEMYFEAKDGFSVSEDIVGKINGQDHDDTYGPVYDGEGGVYLNFNFDPLHEHVAGEEYESDENGHWNPCTTCGKHMNEAAHEFEWVIDKEATDSEKGSKHEECKVCGYQREAVEIPAKNPATGDNSGLILWIAVLFAAGAGAGLVIFDKKRKGAAR